MYTVWVTSYYNYKGTVTTDITNAIHAHINMINLLFRATRNIARCQGSIGTCAYSTRAIQLTIYFCTREVIYYNYHLDDYCHRCGTQPATVY